jgi:hypothetical protein
VWDYKTADNSRFIRGVAVRGCTETCTGDNYNEYTPLNRALGDAINRIVTA